MYTIRCENKLCTWADTTWIVEVDAEGRVPVRDTGHVPKRFVSREKTGVVDPAKMKAYMDRIRGEEEVSRRGRELPNE